MKIENNITSLPPSALTEEQSRTAKPPAVEDGTVPSTLVQLSPQSAHLKAIEKGYADTPVVDAERVSEIKLAISEGRFKVDATKVADSLIKTAQELIRAHKS